MGKSTSSAATTSQTYIGGIFTRSPGKCSLEPLLHQWYPFQLKVFLLNIVDENTQEVIDQGCVPFLIQHL